MKISELTPAQLLSLVCSTCGAAPKELCELHNGFPRNHPHYNRQVAAADAMARGAAKGKGMGHRAKP